MRLSDFDYNLPKEMIAQSPEKKRDHSKLLFYDLKKDDFEHLRFYQILDKLKSGDTLVVNDSRVVNARLFGNKRTGGKVELLILNPHSSKQYDKPDSSSDDFILECLIKGKVRPGLDINLKIDSTKEHNIIAKIIDRVDGGRYKVEFKTSLHLPELLTKYGRLPLPPYIKKNLKIPEQYQTIYSKVDGSVAAPTAGLHFTQELMSNLEKKGISIANITLHISYGTFTPVRSDEISKHRMEQEYTIITEEDAKKINQTLADPARRLVAVGTTSVRTLETLALNYYKLKSSKTPIKLGAWEGWTDLFIYPGFKFKAGIDILITNFHLPKSTLLMLVSAFAGRENILKAYQEAIKRKYRVYSLGDAMMIIK
jgi:S-adenosylmethionine:tRNA ribosyltransferase-isomerase